MKSTKTNKGITLIALIITIVVLLILAVVAISSITNDGVLHYAQNAADSWNQAQTNEVETLQGYLDYLSGLPKAPTDIEGVSISGKNFTVKAVGGLNATGYQYSKDGTNWSTTVASGTEYTFTDLFPEEYSSTNNKWTVYAKSVNDKGESDKISLTIISFNNSYDHDYTVYYAKEGTTIGEFIENSYANQNHGWRWGEMGEDFGIGYVHTTESSSFNCIHDSECSGEPIWITSDTVIDMTKGEFHKH